MTALASTTTLPDLFSPRASRALGQRLGDSARRADVRAEAAAGAETRAWPVSYLERPWKYLDVSRLDLGPFVPAMDASPGAVAGEHRSCPVTGEHATVLEQENGETVFTEDSPEGLTVVPFERADPEMSRVIDAHYATGVPFDRNRFTMLHYAFERGGILVHVAPNTEVELPVRLLRRYEAAGQFAAPHTVIVTGANSRVSVIEDYRSGDGDVLAVPAVEVFPGPGSEVRYTALHRWGADTQVVSEQRMIPARDAAFIGLHLATGGRVLKSHIESSLSARGSSSVLYGLSLGAGSEHHDFYTVQDHIDRDTRSDLLFKSALKDRSRGVYYGVTRVGLGAKNADANQEDRNLILGKGAKADSDPVLEILTSDIIRCSHGATAGPVDEEQLFYLQARGIPHAIAEGMLVRAFLGQVLDRVPDEALRLELASALEEKLKAA